MSGANRKKKDGQRPENAEEARRRDREQATLEAETRQRSQDVSNLTDGDVAGPDWKRNDRQGRG